MTIQNPGNRPPVKGADSTLPKLIANDANQTATLFYDATNLPPGLYVDPTMGTSRDGGGGAAAGGPYTTTISASDGSFTDSTSFTWTVTCPITFTPPVADLTNAEGSTINDSAAATIAGGGWLIYSAVGLPPGLMENTGNGEITGQIALGTAADGPYYVTVTATGNTTADPNDVNIRQPGVYLDRYLPAYHYPDGRPDELRGGFGLREHQRQRRLQARVRGHRAAERPVDQREQRRHQRQDRTRRRGQRTL